jgi:hypothetical protein
MLVLLLPTEERNMRAVLQRSRSKLHASNDFR